MTWHGWWGGAQVKQGAALVRQVPSALWAPFKLFGRKSIELSGFLHRKDVAEARHAFPPHGAAPLMASAVFSQRAALVPEPWLETPCPWPWGMQGTTMAPRTGLLMQLRA